MGVFKHRGWCPLCEDKVEFVAQHQWFRDHLLCERCRSIPRERALFKVIKDYYPNYRELTIHESSPGGRGASAKLARECRNYSTSHFFENHKTGVMHPTGFRCENIEALTFSDASFDLFVTQDVMEHIMNPDKAFKEIARVLRPGGAHIFSAPLINKTTKSERMASVSPGGEIIHHHPPEYHGNPVDAKGSLVTMHWGYDIAAYIQDVADMPTVIFQIDDIDMGIRAEYIDILASFKKS